MFVSLHMDSAPNPLARGASVYSLVRRRLGRRSRALRGARESRRCSAERAATARSQSMLSDLAMRDQMSASAGPRDAAGQQVGRAGSSFGRSRIASPLSTCFAAPTRPPCCSRPATSAMPTTRCCCATRSTARRSSLALAQAIEADVARALAPIEADFPPRTRTRLDAARMKFERLTVPDLAASRPRRLQPEGARAGRPVVGAQLGPLADLGGACGCSPCSPRCGSISRAACRRRETLLAYQPPLPTNVRGYDGDAGPDLRPRAPGRARYDEYPAAGRPRLHLGRGQELLQASRHRLSRA